MSINATLLAQMIVFAVFVWFTMKFVWPPIMQAMRDRQKRISEGLAAADAEDIRAAAAAEGVQDGHLGKVDVVYAVAASPAAFVILLGVMPALTQLTIGRTTSILGAAAG